ncbi:MAG: M23 family metallopeptidase, partial [Deltaproteobacteria bacterium]|nr:M23 family metallopeptidase [Deltaproteobacteria bacterium]
LIIAGGGYILFFENEKPTAYIETMGNYLGQNSTFQYTVSDQKSGIKSITLRAVQGDKKKVLYSISFPRSSYRGPGGPTSDSKTVPFNAIPEGFKDGPLTLTLEVTDFSFYSWFKGNKTIVQKQVTVDTRPPQIQILHGEKYIIPGGSGIAIYRLSEDCKRHGVMVNEHFNPGFAIGDGREDTFISFFALPFDTERIDSLSVDAVDKAGNSSSTPFTTIYKAVRKKKDRINVGDGFLSRKIPEFQRHYPDLSGSSLEKYLYINNSVRKLNNQQIRDLCNNPHKERLWKGRFLRMAGSSRAGFADYRTYYYGGKAIDHQVHLGMDIASTQRAEVRAANRGIVIFADYLGIYGNMVMLDHGQGVFSLYSHLSKINVTPGDNVNQKAVLGLTGKTGMAGGDHLHFSMLVNGIFVLPREWWDQHWIDVNIEEPITDSKF